MPIPSAETLSVAARLLAGCWLLFRTTPLRNARPGWRRPALSVVVPARNEEAVLPSLLKSLRPQLRSTDEIIVVDDHSSDATAAVAAAAGATLLRSPVLPAGWTGKPWACHHGARAAHNGLLVFVDADVTVEDGGLDRVVAAAEAEAPGGLFSVQPFHRTERPIEQLSAMFNTITQMGTNAFTPLGSRLAPRGAFGPCLVTLAADYHAIGGHAAVAGSVLDDMDLAEAYRQSGRPVAAAAGRGTLRYRMYPDGLAALVEGWSKNLAAGAGKASTLTLLMVVAWVSVGLQTAWWSAELLWNGEASTADPGFVVALYGLFVLQLSWMWRRIGRFGWWAPLLFPLHMAFFVAVFARSAYLIVVRGQVGWKGRQISLKTAVRQ